MPIDYVATVKAKSKEQLIEMLQSVKDHEENEDWPAGKAFEHIVLRAFDLEGAIVTWPFEVKAYGATIEQIDGAVYCDHLACPVESKDYSDPNNIEPIAKLRNQLTRRPSGTLGLLFARSGFTEPAKMLTRMISPLNILLWEFEELEQGLRDSTMCRALKTKYMYAVETAAPDYDTRTGLR